MQINWRLFRYPQDDARWPYKFLTGAVVGALWFLIIPAIMMSGYGLETLRQTLEQDQPVLPAWKGNWGRVLINGLKRIVISIIYNIIPLLLWVFIGAMLALPLVDVVPSGAPTVIVTVLATIAGLIVIPLQIIFAYLSLVGTVRMAAHEMKLGAAFAFGEVFRLVRTQLRTLGLSALVWYMANYIVGIISGMLIGGLYLWPFMAGALTMYTNALYGALLADGWKAATLEIVEE